VVDHASEAAGSATISISRNAPDDVQDRWIRVNIDDLPQEILKYGEVLTREVTPGRHRVRAHNTLSRHAIEFDASPGEHVRIQCHNSIARGGALTLLTMGVAYIKVRLQLEG
jgi:hypothetical protein